MTRFLSHLNFGKGPLMICSLFGENINLTEAKPDSLVIMQLRLITCVKNHVVL